MRTISMGALGLLGYYFFGYVVDPSHLPIEGWIALAAICGLITLAAGHISPSGIVAKLWRTIMAQHPPAQAQQNYTVKQNPPAAPNGVGDFIKLQVGDAKRKFIEVQTEETRKTAEAKRQALLQADERRAAEHAARQAARKPVVDVVPVIIEPRYTLRQAIEASTERDWIIGQEAMDQPDAKAKPTGRLLHFDYQTNHVAIIGATGSGKTESTAMLFVNYARRFGLHVIVLDGKKGIDWRRFDGVVEWHSATIETIEHQIDQLYRVFEARWAELLASGVGKIYDLPGKRKRTLFVIMEEFGYLWTLIKNNKSLHEKLGSKIDDLFRLGRAAGIVICLMDQAPEEWSKQMRANAKFVVCYRLNGQAGHVFNEYHAGKLPSAGTFSQSNTFYDAWWFADQLDLVRSCPRQEKRYITNFVPVRSELSRELHEPSERSQSSHERSHTGELHELSATPPKVAENGPKTAPPAPSEFVRMYELNRTWDAVAKEFFAQNPHAKQVELTRLMARITNDGRAPEAFKSEANRVFHLYNPKGNNYGQVMQ